MNAIEEVVALEAIRKVKYLYAHHLDAKNLEGLVELFTEDAVCEFGSSYGEWRGRDEIRAGFQIEIDKVRGIDYPFMHAVTTPWVEITAADTATAKWFLLEMGTESTEVEAPLRLTGVYTDTYKKIDGRWRIAHTHLDFTWPMRDVSPVGAA